MRLNEKKTKNMIFNFSRKYQFITDLKVNNKSIEIVKETKLLGTFLTDDLKWNEKSLQKNAAVEQSCWIHLKQQDLKKIYLTFIRSILDHSAVVWHSSLTAKNRRDLERVQKAAVRVILGRNYSNYNDGLKKLKLENLNKRREGICLRFSKNCLNNEKVRSMFPKNSSKHKMKKRKPKNI